MIKIFYISIFQMIFKKSLINKFLLSILNIHKKIENKYY